MERDYSSHIYQSDTSFLTMIGLGSATDDIYESSVFEQDDFLIDQLIGSIFSPQKIMQLQQTAPEDIKPIVMLDMKEDLKVEQKEEEKISPLDELIGSNISPQKIMQLQQTAPEDIKPIVMLDMKEDLKVEQKEEEKISPLDEPKVAIQPIPTKRRLSKGEIVRIPKNIRNRLLDWMDKHRKHPYPTSSEKQKMCEKYKIPRKTLDHFFINNRRRYVN